MFILQENNRLNIPFIVKKDKIFDFKKYYVEVTLLSDLTNFCRHTSLDFIFDTGFSTIFRNKKYCLKT
ncbi:hypothetical protein QFZ31_005261 [Neobacillus niacini]|nr:hypothetical protein [Neobacillus niacini]